MTVLFMIFWFQAILNVTNSFILHTIVQQFHKRNSFVGKVARGFFLAQFLLLWFQLTFALGINNTIDGQSINRDRLQCSPQIYPYEWYWLYFTDFNAGLISVVLYFMYNKNVRLDDGTYNSEKELRNLVNFIAYSFDAHGIRKIDML